MSNFYLLQIAIGFFKPDLPKKRIFIGWIYHKNCFALFKISLFLNTRQALDSEKYLFWLVHSLFSTIKSFKDYKNNKINYLKSIYEF